MPTTTPTAPTAPLEPLVYAALARRSARARRVAPLASGVFRVDADDGQTYALRARPGSDRAFGNIPLELAWIAALRRETDIEPSEPVPGLDGALVQALSPPWAGTESYDCVLFRWIPGVELAQRLTRRTYAASVRSRRDSTHTPPRFTRRRTC